MAQIEVDLSTFKHSLKNLNKGEILLILQQYNWEIDSRQAKKELVEYLIDKILKGEITAEMYYSFREKAFSENKNFYDGFFYKIDTEYINFDISEFQIKLKERAKNTSDDIKININILEKNNNIIRLNYERIKESAFYDYSKNVSKLYKQLLNADIEIYIKQGLVYIHSKNLTDSKIIKTFLDKCFSSLNVVNKKKKVLSEPKFDVKKADEWYEKNKDYFNFKINGTSIHMLDLFFEFDSEKSKFSGICMKRIYFKENIIYADNEEIKITDSQYGGYNLQNHIKIIDEIINEKRILGFSLEADHLYEDEETGEEYTTTLPITILYEDKNYLRLSISSECLVAVKEEVLKQAYFDIKEIFINKYISNNIINDENLKAYLLEICEQKSNEEKIEKEVSVGNNLNKDNNYSEKWSL